MYAGRVTLESILSNRTDDDFKPKPPTRTFSRSADEAWTSSGTYFPDRFHDEPSRSSNLLALSRPLQGGRHVRVSNITALLQQCCEKLAASSDVCSKRNTKASKDSDKQAFAELSVRLRDIAFKLRLWGFEVGLSDTTEKTLVTKDAVDINLVEDTFQRMEDRLTQVEKLCKEESVDTLSMHTRHQREENEDDDVTNDLYDFDLSDEDDNASNAGSDFGFDHPVSMQDHLDSLESQLRTLSRCSNRMMSMLFPNHAAYQAHEKLLNELAHYFGTQEAVSRYHVDMNRFSGSSALEEAKATAHELGEDMPSLRDGSSDSNYLKPPESTDKLRRKSDEILRPAHIPPKGLLTHNDGLDYLEDFFISKKSGWRRG